MKLINGDCFDEIFSLKENSIDLCLTSPPYLGIGKDYDESIDYHSLIVGISKCSRSVAWQVGNIIEKGSVIPIDIITWPYFREINMHLTNRIIWTFGHGLHCKNRFSHRYETVMVYRKEGEKIFNLDPVRVPQKYPNKKHYKGPNKGKLSGNPLGKNPGDVWEIPNVKHNHPEKTGHPCQFPEALAERLVLAFTNEGDTVLDPLMGSGTVGVVCKKLKRKFIGIEKKKDFFEMAIERINPR